jgi:hypothetical protein
VCLIFILSLVAASAATTATTIVFRDDGCANSFDFFMLVLDLFSLGFGIGV